MVFTTYLVFTTSCFAQRDTANQIEALKNAFQNPTIIGLGETGHGYNNINTAKASMAKYLFEKENFKALLFESSFVQGVIVHLLSDSSKKRLSKFLYPYWNTEHVDSLVNFIIKRENSIPLIGGFDIQEDCRFVYLTTYLIDNNIITSNRVELLLCDSILSLYIGNSDIRKQTLSSKEYEILLGSYNLITNEISEKFSLGETRKKLLLRCIDNRKWLCKYLTISNWNDKMYFRDSLMAQNIIWQKDHLYKSDKVILWAADAHIAKSVGVAKKPKWMGEWLTSTFNKNYFAISFKKGSSGNGIRFPENAIFSLNKIEDKFQAVIYLEKLIKIKSEQWLTPCPY